MAVVTLRERVESFGLGWWLALIVALVAIILGFMNLLPKEHAFLVVAVCSIRL